MISSRDKLIPAKTWHPGHMFIRSGDLCQHATPRQFAFDTDFCFDIDNWFLFQTCLVSLENDLCMGDSPVGAFSDYTDEDCGVEV